MNYAVKTTHAIPPPPTCFYLTRKTLSLTCTWCGQTLGVWSTVTEREILDACHTCEAKLRDLGPVSAVPFS